MLTEDAANGLRVHINIPSQLKAFSNFSECGKAMAPGVAADVMLLFCARLSRAAIPSSILRSAGSGPLVPEAGTGSGGDPHTKPAHHLVRCLLPVGMDCSTQINKALPISVSQTAHNLSVETRHFHNFVEQNR